ncbi:hypothetical protein KSP39_PZI004933 [Platanthera zijinensis]|uniref:DUF4283 domain-containing protein n=1 Tax=Platanthera zijinensis TaxID=2320716 RepID=A0AAP0GCN9_9ASPA
MCVLKWSIVFNLKVESRIILVWISLPNLCLEFMNSSALFSIGSLFGKSLRMDNVTVEKLQTLYILLELIITSMNTFI